MGAGCITINAPSATSPVVPTPAPVPAPMPPTGTNEATPSEGMSCPQTPQVYYFNKLAFSRAEVSSIEANVVAPLVAYYDGLPGQRIVSIVIRRTDSGISVEAVVDQPDTDEPVFSAFIHPRTGGTYPRWYPEEVPPGYAG